MGSWGGVMFGKAYFPGGGACIGIFKYMERFSQVP